MIKTSKLYKPRGQRVAEAMGKPYVGPFEQATVHERLDYLLSKHNCEQAGCNFYRPANAPVRPLYCWCCPTEVINAQDK